MNEVEVFQENMLLIRRCLGWTASDLGDRIGVTRQTVNNLESNRPEKYKLSRTQYLAMRYILDEEIRKHPKETEMVQTLLEILIDNPESVSDEERRKVIEKANMFAPSILAKTATREEVSDEWMGLLGLGVLGAAVAAIAAAILKK